MHIKEIWVSQKCLARRAQIPHMVRALEEEYLPPISLIRCEDGEIQVDDGHHRLMAYWLSGRRTLEKEEYTLAEKDQWKSRKGKVVDLLAREAKYLHEIQKVDRGR